MKIVREKLLKHGGLILFYVIFLSAFFLVGNYFFCDSRPVPREVSYSRFKWLVRGKEVVKATIDEKTGIEARLKNNEFIIANPPANDPELLKLLEENGVEYSIKKNKSGGNGQWIPVLAGLMPMVLIFIFFVWMMRGFASAGAKSGMEFTKHKAKLLNEASGKVTFADVAGCDEAKEEIAEVVDFLKNPRRYSALGAKIPKGVLFIGPPGTGKTLLARAVAGEAGVAFYYISGSDFVEMFVGVGAARVRNLFDDAIRRTPCIVFIDEIDAIGRHRGAGVGGGNDEREQTLNSILSAIDGFEVNSGLVIIGATNRQDVLDPAFMRAGRFDRKITVDRPDLTGREAILKVHAKKLPWLEEDVNLLELAKETPGMVGADLANVVNEAALAAVRDNAAKVARKHFSRAIQAVALGGREQKSKIINPEQKYSVAVHETGHFIATLMNPENRLTEVRYVSIIRRGQALGLNWLVPNEDGLPSEDNIRGLVIAYLGGRAAEELILKTKTAGAGSDLARATQIARDMVQRYGMSALGPIALQNQPENPFFGKYFGEQSPISQKTAELADTAVSEILNNCYEKSKEFINAHRALFDAVVAELLEKETLDKDELDAIVAKYRQNS